ncbi:MAG: hypothetical protein FWH22_02500 [Fibromonadales bacterium]|nr:hypothetical protein [Fibromonadales bacterium]
METFKKISLLCIALLGCGGEWESGTIGKVSCSFGSFDDFLPALRRPVKMASGNNGNLYILDDSYNVHFYKRDNLYECAFNLEESYSFSGFPSDVISAGNSFYVQDIAELKSWDNKTVCNARNGVFAIRGNELAVGSNMGLEVWSINPCAKNRDVPSQKVFALTATDSEYFAAEGISMPMNLTMHGSFTYSDPMSQTSGNEKHFCSADRLAANNYGVYLLDKTCRKIGVYDNQAVWRKTLSLDSLGIRNVLDIAPAEYSYILIMHSSGVVKVNVM